MKTPGILLVTALFFATAIPVQAGGLSNKLLLSSLWCSFSYNKVSGYTSSTRTSFNPKGTYSVASRGEGYSSGNSGSMASQDDSVTGGRWQVVNGELYMSEGGGELAHVETVLKQNSNGYPIIIADGVEYSQCN